MMFYWFCYAPAISFLLFSQPYSNLGMQFLPNATMMRKQGNKELDDPRSNDTKFVATRTGKETTKKLVNVRHEMISSLVLVDLHDERI